jgi:tetratricopeptide (TPR) repeat protein
MRGDVRRGCKRIPIGVLSLLLLCAAAAFAGDDDCDLLNSSSFRKSADAALEVRQYGLAAQEFQKALDACPAQRLILLDLSQAQAHNRDFPQALHTAQRFLELEPNSIPGRLALANVYFMAQKFSESKAECERVLRIDPKESVALKLKGNIEYLTGEFGHAEDTFISVLDRHPNDEDAAYMLGRIYYTQGRIDYAVGQFQRVLKINPQSYKAYDNLGLCYQAQGETELAIRHFLTAIKIVEKDHPKYDWPYANLADLLLENNKFQEAFAAASKAADRNPYAARNFYLGGKALCKLQKLNLCVNWLQRSVSLDPNYPEPLYLLSKAYADAGQPELARQTLEKFREVKAKHPQTRR